MEVIPFNRTAYGIEIKFIITIIYKILVLLIAPLMELKSHLFTFVNRNGILLIAPLMELKWRLKRDIRLYVSTFNRTAYGIEIRIISFFMILNITAFNRTAYGIEIELMPTK